MSNHNMSRPQNVQTAKCTQPQIVKPQNVQTAKCPTAECTQPQIVQNTAKCLTARCQDRKMFRPPIGNRSLRSSRTQLGQQYRYCGTCITFSLTPSPYFSLIGLITYFFSLLLIMSCRYFYCRSQEAPKPCASNSNKCS